MSCAAAETTLDAFLGGALMMAQPVGGFRAGLDSVLLAAAVEARPGSLVFEAGVGPGVLAACLLKRCEGVRLSGLEIQPAMAALARENLARNALTERAEIIAGDLFAPPRTEGGLEAWGRFDVAVSNPPFLRAEHGNPPPDPLKAAAHTLSEHTLGAWIERMLKALRPKGLIALILRADCLDEALSALYGRAGECAVFPLWPAAGVPAKRVILTARKGVAGRARLLPGLVLHDGAGALSPEVAALTRAPGALTVR